MYRYYPKRPNKERRLKQRWQHPMEAVSSGASGAGRMRECVSRYSRRMASSSSSLISIK